MKEHEQPFDIFCVHQREKHWLQWKKYSQDTKPKTIEREENKKKKFKIKQQKPKPVERQCLTCSTWTMFINIGKEQMTCMGKVGDGETWFKQADVQRKQRKNPQQIQMVHFAQPSIWKHSKNYIMQAPNHSKKHSTTIDNNWQWNPSPKKKEKQFQFPFTSWILHTQIPIPIVVSSMV